MSAGNPWYVVIERLDMDDQPLPSYAVGPFTWFSGAKDEMNSETGMVHALMTIDAKAEKYQAVDVYASQSPHSPFEVIAPAIGGLR